MGLHSSLKVDTAGEQQRSVLSRIERIKDLMKKGLWSEEKSVLSLPKTKVIKIKSGKSKSKEEKADAAAAAGTAAPGAPAPGAPQAAAAKPKK